MFRSLALAGALAAGLTTTAAAQSVYVDTPFFGFSAGEPSYHDYGPRAYYAPRYSVGPYGYERGYYRGYPRAYRFRSDRTVYGRGG